MTQVTGCTSTASYIQNARLIPFIYQQTVNLIISSYLQWIANFPYVRCCVGNLCFLLSYCY